MSGDDRDIMFPRASGQFIAKNAKHITISADGVKNVAQMIVADPAICGKGAAGVNYAADPTHPSPEHPAAANWVFVISTLNFSFWTPAQSTKYLVRWNGTLYSGYVALCAAVKRAVAEGYDIINPRVFAAITADRLRQVLRSDTETPIPLLDERVKALNEAGRVLLERYDGSFENCVRAADGSALKLVALVTEHFPSYRDRAQYCGRTVSFYKRAQILTGDLWSCFGGQGLGRFNDIEQLTMFADYRVPQVLHHLHVLRYSEQLAGRLATDALLESGDEMEVEIRGCSIHAVDMIVAAARELEAASSGSSQINCVKVDYFLWLYRRQHDSDISSPYHKTRCIYY